MQIERADALSIIESRNQEERRVIEQRARELRHELSRSQQNFESHRQRLIQMKKQFYADLKMRAHEQNMPGILARTSENLKRQQSHLKLCETQISDLNVQLRESGNKFQIINHRLEKLVEIKTQLIRTKQNRVEERQSEQHIVGHASGKLKFDRSPARPGPQKSVNRGEHSIDPSELQKKSYRKARCPSDSQSSHKTSKKNDKKLSGNFELENNQAAWNPVLPLPVLESAVESLSRSSTQANGNTAKESKSNAICRAEIEASPVGDSVNMREIIAQSPHLTGSSMQTGFGMKDTEFSIGPQNMAGNEGPPAQESKAGQSFQDLHGWRRGSQEGLSLSYQTTKGRKLRLFLQKDKSQGIEVRIVQLDSGAMGSIRPAERSEVKNALLAAGIELKSIHFEQSSGERKWRNFIQPGY